VNGMRSKESSGIVITITVTVAAAAAIVVAAIVESSLFSSKETLGKATPTLLELVLVRR
jgi:hypothetical protein